MIRRHDGPLLVHLLTGIPTAVVVWCARRRDRAAQTWTPAQGMAVDAAAVLLPWLVLHGSAR
ncbi:hypothetical protein [Streptomyces griseorubiginosus]|uniref:hypothetical protein n=1 Tax=Streptomyces griseorubiginosus TaxID=67304 RepID=UPI001AD79C0E|nr:hypothetical protein [Streptomyces griseorubiginosus]MBO4255685.1 hypothetical protein [Streptomyces griseorubiginosus]